MNPPGLATVSLSNLLESALNTAIRLDEQQGQAFSGLEDSVIKVHLTPIEQPLYFLFTEHNVSVQNTLTGEADAAVELSLIDFIALPFTHTPPNSTLQGNAALAQIFLDALCALDIDWEEHLSHYTGDLVAFKIGHGIRTFFETKQDAKETIGETLRDYLQFEIEALPTQRQVTHFSEAVDQVTHKVDQLALRIDALLAKQSSPSSNR